jgi:hypothetical protein
MKKLTLLALTIGLLLALASTAAAATFQPAPQQPQLSQLQPPPTFILKSPTGGLSVPPSL